MARGPHRSDRGGPVTSVTPEALRTARIAEATRRYASDKRSVLDHLCDLYETNWTPPEPVSDDVLAMRAWLKDNTAHIGPYVDGGSADGVSQARAYLAGCTRGREGAAGLAEALEAMVDEQCDYMRLNVLGDPEVQHNIKLARAALASAKRGG